MNPILENLLSKADLLILSLIWAALLWMALRNQYMLAKTLAEKVAGTPPIVVPPVVHSPSPAPAPQPATPPVVVDQGLVNAVKKFEGFQPHAYGDYKQYSIGYGTKATSPDEIITQAEAEKRLMAELAIAEQSVESFSPNAPVGVKQALTSLTYNAGPIWQRQELGQLIKAGSYEEAKAHFLQYNHAGGEVNDGLTKRRQAEVQWFDHPL